MKNKVKKVIIWVVLLIFVTLLGWRVFELVRKDESVSRGGFGGALAVETELMRRETVREVREFSGSVRPAYQYIITAKVAGRLDEVYKQAGDYVKANELIAVLDDTEYQLSLRQAEANLADAESQKFAEEQDFKRSQNLFDKEYITLSEFEQAQSAYNSVEAKLKLAEAGHGLAELKLKYTQLRASKAGFIAERYYDEGNFLTVNSAVVTVVGIETVRIKSNLVESVYGRINIGQLATIETDAYAGEIFSGTVSVIAPVLNEESRMAEMEIEVENDNYKLKPGMFCKIKLILSASENAQTVPNKAILKENGKSGIYVVDDDIAHYILVKTGISDEYRTEILTPKIDKPVITLGQYQVKDGSKVQTISK
ncbi:MAG: efflux RND transporter periplasmic adaptor subunit [Candidatus Cloacimonetes bacterium]|nr:efflux RND transporter periplasmic adaptor subunit [Candidatus Cloacimonadota bacterium]